MDNLILSYDACPRVVEYGVNDQVSYLRLHEDVPRAVAVSAPALQGSTLYGRCSIAPTTGAQFQSVTLSSLAVFQQSAGGPIDLGDQLPASFMNMVSTLVQTSPTNPIWDFDLLIDPAFFIITETYYLEATLDLTFANTGPLTRRLRMPIRRAKTLRAQSNINASGGELVAIYGRVNDANRRAGIFSQTFRMAAPAASDGTTIDATVVVDDAESTEAPNDGTSSDSTMAIAIGAAVGGVVLAAALIVIIVVALKRRRRDRANSDAPLMKTAQLPMSSADLDF
jgi:hypothetical protein